MTLAGNPYAKTGKRGRPSKLDAAAIADAVKIIEDGAMLGMLPGLLEVPASTYYDWMERGRREAARRQKWEKIKHEATPEAKAEAARLRRNNALYLEFSEAVTMAVQNRDRGLLSIIQKAAQGTQKLTVKSKKELRTTAQGTPESPIIDRELIETERTETRSVEIDWRAAQYLLEKGQPQIFGPRATIDVRKALEVDPAAFADMELPELLEIARQLEGALAGAGDTEE